MVCVRRLALSPTEKQDGLSRERSSPESSQESTAVDDPSLPTSSTVAVDEERAVDGEEVDISMYALLPRATESIRAGDYLEYNDMVLHCSHIVLF